MEYYSAIKKNQKMPFAVTWMDLEIAIPSEVSQTEKDKYHMISLLKKMVQGTYLQNRNRVTDVENKIMVTRGERGGGGINWEFGIDMYTLLYLK